MTNKPEDRSRVTGTVYQTSRCRNDLDEVGFGHLYVKILQTTDEDGWYSVQGADKIEAGLQGLYSQVWNRWREDNSPPQIRYIGALTFDWNESLKVNFNDLEFRDLMAYYHVTLARQQFGISLSDHLIKALDSSNCLSEMRVIKVVQSAKTK